MGFRGRCKLNGLQQWLSSLNLFNKDTMKHDIHTAQTAVCLMDRVSCFLKFLTCYHFKILNIKRAGYVVIYLVLC